MFKFLARLGSDTNGATAIEYGLIVSLIFLAMMAGVSSFGQNLGGMWNMVSNTVSSTA